MTQLTLLGAAPGDDGSPFDKIRRERPDGSEYWSARELMSLLGYETWQRFAETIERARVACELAGGSTSMNFSDVAKNSGPGRPAQDVELSRFACYLVAMRGDERKPEIAAALTYFAIKTREAEVRQELSEREQALMLARQLLAADARAGRAEASLVVADRQRELDAPKVEAFDDFLDDAGRRTLVEFGKMRGMLGPEKIIAFMTQIGMLRIDNGLPIQEHINRGRLVVNVHGQTEITHKGMVYVRARVIGARKQDRL